MIVSDEVTAIVEDAGVLVVPKPIVKQVFFQSLKLANSMRRRLLSLRSENSKLQRKIEEIKLVDRAKWALIQYLHMNEQQARDEIFNSALVQFSDDWDDISAEAIEQARRVVAAVMPGAAAGAILAVS